MKTTEALKFFYENQYIKGNSLSTISAYKSQISPFIKFSCDVEISKITYKLYCEYITSLRSQSKKLSSVSIRSYANSLRVFLNYLYLNHFISEDIAAKIVLPKQLKTVPLLISSELILKILKNYDTSSKIGSRNILILVLAFDCGLRLSELTRLNVEDFNISDKVIRVTRKTNKQSYVPLSSTVEFYYKNYLNFYNNKSNGPLLLDFHDKKITNSAISSLFKRIRKKYNLARFYPHQLRHSYATLFLYNGGDSLALQELLGHTTLDMTKKYVQMSNALKVFEQSKYSPLSN